MNEGDADEDRGRRCMRIAWMLLFLGPILLLSGWYLGAIAAIESSKSGDTGLVIYSRWGSWVCFLGGLGSVAGFVGLSLRHGKPPGAS